MPLAVFSVCNVLIINVLLEGVFKDGLTKGVLADIELRARDVDAQLLVPILSIGDIDANDKKMNAVYGSERKLTKSLA